MGSCVPATSLTGAQTRPCCLFKLCSPRSSPRRSTLCWAAPSSSCPTRGPSSSGSATTSECWGSRRVLQRCLGRRGSLGPRRGGAQRGAAAGGHSRFQGADVIRTKSESGQALGCDPGCPGCGVLGLFPHVLEPRPPMKWGSHDICQRTGLWAMRTRWWAGSDPLPSLSADWVCRSV